MNEMRLPAVPPLFVTFSFLIIQGWCGSECLTWPESHTSLLIASLFAESMGFTAEDLTTNKSMNIFSQWLKGNCQPNYRKVCIRVNFSSLVLVKDTLAAERFILSKGIEKHTKVVCKIHFFFWWESWCSTAAAYFYSNMFTLPITSTELLFFFFNFKSTLLISRAYCVL